MSSTQRNDKRPVTYPALVEKYGPGSKYQWVSPQTNKGTGHFRYTRSNGSTNNVPFNVRPITGFGPAANANEAAEAFKNISGIGLTTIDLPQLKAGSPFGWSHEKDMWVYKNPDENKYFTSKFAPVALVDDTRPVTYNPLVEKYGPESRYQWVSPQMNKGTGHFRYTRKNGSTNNVPFNVRSITGFGPAANADEAAAAFVNVSGMGQTTIDLPDLPVGSPFGWSHEMDMWIYKHPKEEKYFTSKFAPVDDTRPVTYPALVEKYGPGSKYQWVSPQMNKDTGHFRYTRTNGSTNNVPFNVRSITGFGPAAGNMSAAFENVSGMGQTTIDLPGLPLGAPFGWSHDMNMWIYKKDNNTYFTSKFVPVDDTRPVTYKALVEKYGPGSKYQWVSPQMNNGTGHFRYTRANGTTNNAPFNVKQITGFGASKVLAGRADLSEPFSKVSGMGKTTIELPGLPKGSPFGWSHERNKWIYKNPETGVYFTSLYSPGRAQTGGKRQTRRRY